MTAHPRSPRLDVRDRVMAVLLNRTAAQDRVRKNLTRRQLERMLELGPVIRVYLFQEKGEKDSEEPHSTERTLELVLHITALADEDVDDVLEALTFDAEARLFSDPLLNGWPVGDAEPLAKSFEFDRMTMAPDEESGFGHQATVYKVVYYTGQPDSGSLDDFITADILTEPADGTPDTPPGHDRLILPQ